MENELKQRNGCVTAWLWLAMIANVAMAVIFIISIFRLQGIELVIGAGVCSVLSLLNVLGAIMLMRWNKTGFYMMIVSSLIGAAVNIMVLNESPVVVISTLLALVVWWAILQIRKDGVSAWSQLETGWDYAHCRHLYQVFSVIGVILIVLTIIGAVKNSGKSSYDVSDAGLAHEI